MKDLLDLFKKMVKICQTSFCFRSKTRNNDGLWRNWDP